MIYKNIKELMTLAGVHQKDGRHLQPEDLSIQKNITVVEKMGKITWLGDFKNLPQEFAQDQIIDCQNLVATPALVDSHTHLVFGGDRSFEYSMKLNGATYEEIAQAGGGILNTMESTLKTSLKELRASAIQRLETLISYGIKTVEIKSGYALEYQREKELSYLIADLKKEFEGRIVIFNTYMCAHAVPKNYISSHEFIKKVVIPLMEELSQDKIIDAVDIFHEVDYFDADDVKTLFEKAHELKLPVKIHADEFNDNDGARLAAKYQALSADHLLATSDKGIKALAESNTVATLLPGTAFFLGKPLARARDFLDAGCKVALATDYNPGSCHCDNLMLIAQLSGKNLKMNSAEIFAGITYNAAHALGLRNQGAIIVGMDAKLSFFKTSSLDMLLYHWGKNFAITPQV